MAMLFFGLQPVKLYPTIRRKTKAASAKVTWMARRSKPYTKTVL